MTTSFTVDITGTTGMRTGEWAEGEEFLVLPDDRQRAADAAARIRLYAQDDPAVNGGRTSLRKATPWRRGRPVTVAQVEQRTRLRGTAPHPVLVVHDAEDRPVATLYPEQREVADPRTFRLVDDADTLLCRITHAPARFGRREFWRIEPADGGTPLTGRRGTCLGWVGYVVSFPVWLLFFVGSLLVTVFTLGEVTEMLVWGPPQRVAWRRRLAAPVTGTALDFRYLRTGYRWNDRLLDARIAYAQAALHNLARMHQS